jgi:hypothetical protein
MTILDIIADLGMGIYAYCTDFTINIANLTNTSYYEVNFFLFCVLFPVLLITLPCTAFFLKFKLKKLKQLTEIQ